MHTCPNCGYCPHCGRSNRPVPMVPAPWQWPSSPNTFPVYPAQPIWVDPSVLRPYGYPTITYSAATTSGTLH